VSQCSRVLNVLRDHKPHSIQEIHERAGTMRLNSRISDLRKFGFNIAYYRLNGLHTYELLPSLVEPEAHGAQGDPATKSRFCDPFETGSGSMSVGAVQPAAGETDGSAAPLLIGPSPRTVPPEAASGISSRGPVALPPLEPQNEPAPAQLTVWQAA
jgi:Helix-turn-helix domain